MSPQATGWSMTTLKSSSASMRDQTRDTGHGTRERPSLVSRVPCLVSASLIDDLGGVTSPPAPLPLRRAVGWEEPVLDRPGQDGPCRGGVDPRPCVRRADGGPGPGGAGDD